MDQLFQDSGRLHSRLFPSKVGSEDGSCCLLWDASSGLCGGRADRSHSTDPGKAVEDVGGESFQKDFGEKARSLESPSADGMGFCQTNAAYLRSSTMGLIGRQLSDIATRHLSVHEFVPSLVESLPLESGMKIFVLDSNCPVSTRDQEELSASRRIVASLIHVFDAFKSRGVARFFSIILVHTPDPQGV